MPQLSRHAGFSEATECTCWATASRSGRWSRVGSHHADVQGGVIKAHCTDPSHSSLSPSEWIAGAVGGNSVAANAFASVAGVFMYFATLTEVPILEGLVGNGMGSGPALALLLAGPALSLPSILVVRSVIGWRKTAVYVGLVAVAATSTGLLYGAIT